MFLVSICQLNEFYQVDFLVIFKADNLIKMAEEEEGKLVTFASLVRLCVMYGNFQGFARNIMQGMRIFKV